MSGGSTKSRARSRARFNTSTRVLGESSRGIGAEALKCEPTLRNNVLYVFAVINRDIETLSNAIGLGNQGITRNNVRDDVLIVHRSGLQEVIMDMLLVQPAAEEQGHNDGPSCMIRQAVLLQVVNWRLKSAPAWWKCELWGISISSQAALKVRLTLRNTAAYSCAPLLVRTASINVSCIILVIPLHSE